MTAVAGLGSIPSLLNVLDSARRGIDAGLQSFDQVAAAVRSQRPRGVSANAAVGALLERTQVSASARAFEASEQLLGTLLDLRA